MKLGMEVGLGPSHIVLDGNPAPRPQKRHSPQFLAYVCCGITAERIKMPLGMEVDLGPGDIVLDGDTAHPKKVGGAQHPKFWPMYCGQHVLWPNGCMDQDATWYGSRPWPMPQCVTWGPNSL